MFDTHIQKLGMGGLKKGIRTQVKVRVGRQNLYFYSAVNPMSGEDCSLLAVSVNTDYRSVFLDQILKHLGMVI
jgi:hypothetical protein